MLRLTLLALSMWLLAGCPARQPAPADSGSAGGAGKAADVAPAPEVDPEAVVEHPITGSELQSVHNSMGDRINVEAMDPWPPATGQNVWKISLKPAEAFPLEMGDHITITIINPPSAGTGASTALQFNGGLSGGTLSWTPEAAGDYIIQAGVKRKDAITGQINFRVTVVAGPEDE